MNVLTRGVVISQAALLHQPPRWPTASRLYARQVRIHRDLQHVIHNRSAAALTATHFLRHHDPRSGAFGYKRANRPTAHHADELDQVLGGMALLTAAVGHQLHDFMCRRTDENCSALVAHSFEFIRNEPRLGSTDADLAWDVIMNLRARSERR